MTLPSSGQIEVSQINSEIGYPYNYGGGLSWLNGFIKPGYRPGNPYMSAFYGLTYFQNNAQGNCFNGVQNYPGDCNCACNCNCGDCDCACDCECACNCACGNCGNIACGQCIPGGVQCINCANCDGQAWLQPNCNCACTYNCNMADYSWNCNCNCNCSKIICTKLHELGLMPTNIFTADQLFGAYLRKVDKPMYEGYVRWAQTVVDWMSGDGPAVMIWIRNEEERKKREQQASIKWAHKIATPWSEHMAYLMGTLKTDNEVGRILMGIGKHVCRFVSKLPQKEQMGVSGTWTLCALFFGSYYVASSYVNVKNFFKNTTNKILVRV